MSSAARRVWLRVPQSPLSRVKSLPERSDQRIFLCVAQIIEVGELRHPAFRIDSTVTVSTRLLPPNPAHCLCLTARFATRDEQRPMRSCGVRVILDPYSRPGRVSISRSSMPTRWSTGARQPRRTCSGSSASRGFGPSDAGSPRAGGTDFTPAGGGPQYRRVGRSFRLTRLEPGYGQPVRITIRGISASDTPRHAAALHRRHPNEALAAKLSQWLASCAVQELSVIAFIQAAVPCRHRLRVDHRSSQGEGVETKVGVRKFGGRKEMQPKALMLLRSAPSTSSAANCRPRSSCAGSSRHNRHGPGASALGLSTSGSRYPAAAQKQPAPKRRG